MYCDNLNFKSGRREAEKGDKKKYITRGNFWREESWLTGVY